jgi:outer membrane protein TolC
VSVLEAVRLRVALAGWCILTISATVFAQSAGAPLRLREAVAEALRASPALNSAADAVQNAKIQGKLASSQFDLKVVPNLNAGTAPANLGQRTIGVGVSKRLPFGSEITTSVDSFTYGSGPGALHDSGYTVGVSQPLNRFGAVARADLENAKRSIEGSERALLETRHQLIVAVAERFFGVLKSQRMVRAGELALDRAQTLTTASKARAEVGLVTQLDVLRADLLASQAAVTLANQREQLATALEDLNLLLGRSAAESLDIADEDLSDQALVANGFHLAASAAPAEADRLVREALAARPVVREAHDRVGDAQRTVSVSHWNLLPQASLNASFTQRGLGPAANPGFADLLNGWRVGITTNYALDRAEQTAAAGTASVSLRAAERSAADTERQVEADVRRAYRSWSRSADTIDIQRKTVDMAEKQLRLTTLRYERGLATSLDLVDAETNLYQAETALIGAQVDRAMAALTLERVSGGLDPDRFMRADFK